MPNFCKLSVLIFKIIIRDLIISYFTSQRSGGGQISSVAFDGYGRHIVSGEMDRTVRLWKLSDEKECEKLIGPEKAIIDVDVSFDASMVLSAGHDPGIHLWSLKFNTSRVIIFCFSIAFLVVRQLISLICFSLFINVSLY